MEPRPRSRWLNRTVFGIGLASLFSDWSHEIATAVLPAFLASLGASAAWLGAIEGIADGLSSFAKLASGFYTDRLRRRKPIAAAGYIVTALGTASFGLASAAWHVLAARSAAWLGRGARTPVRKTLMAAAVDESALGRAFGFERMMDTLGAIAGPASAFLLLRALGGDYRALFAWTLVPGLAAAGFIAFLVKERERKPVPYVSFARSLRGLPPQFRRLLAAVGVFGLGDFAHSLLILLAVEKFSPSLGPAGAAAAATGLYLLHNVLYASFAFLAGWLADRFEKRLLLAAAYGLGAAMAGVVIAVPLGLGTLVAVFALGGIYVAGEETLEDSLTAELVREEEHGMAFGSLATVNGIGDFASSLVVGALWAQFGVAAAFGYSAVLFAAGAALALRVTRAP
ncbi:MAG: MFS transporter [Planctomycetota bacterium]